MAIEFNRVMERIDALTVGRDVQQLLRGMMWLEDTDSSRIWLMDVVEQLLAAPLPVGQFEYPAINERSEWRGLLNRIFPENQYRGLAFRLHFALVILRDGDHVPTLVGLMVRSPEIK